VAGKTGGGDRLEDVGDQWQYGRRWQGGVGFTAYGLGTGRGGWGAGWWWDQTTSRLGLMTGATNIFCDARPSPPIPEIF